jgi:hypothetical protein
MGICVHCWCVIILSYCGKDNGSAYHNFMKDINLTEI